MCSGYGIDKILEMMKANSHISITQIATRLGITPRTIKRDISYLQANNKLKRIGSEKSGHWEIIE